MLSHIFYRWEWFLSERDTNRRVHPFEWGLEFVPAPSAARDPKLYLMEYARRALADSVEYGLTVANQSRAH